MIHIFQAALGEESVTEAIDVNDDRSSIHSLFLNSSSGDSVEQTDSTTSGGIMTTLEDKIQKAFELPRLEKRHHEYACWLVKNVLLRGYLLVTDGHLCFWANIPTDEGDVKKSGFLKKRAVGPLKNMHSYWFVLKEDALNIYADSKSLYYPVTRIALRDITKIEVSNKKECGFDISTQKKKYCFQADTSILMNEWINEIRSGMFRCKNEGADVRIVLPLTKISDIKLNRTLSQVESLVIKVQDEELAVEEEYFFAYFNNIEKAYNSILKQRTAVTELQTRLIQSMYDSTNFSALPSKPSPTRSSAATSTEDLNSSISVQQASTVLTKTATARRILSTENLEEVDDSEEDGKSEKDVDSLELPAPSTNNASYDQPSDSSSTSSSSIRTSPDSISSKKWKSIHRKTYSDGNDSSASRSEWKILDSLGFPFSTTATTAILACPRPASGGSSSSATFPITSTSANQPSNSMKPAAVSPSRTWLPSLQIISPSAQDTAIMESTREKNFQNMFSLPKSESLTMAFTVSLVRLLPRVGKIYISNNYVCFYSKFMGSKAKVMIPFSDIKMVSKAKHSKVYYLGLVIYTKDQAEIFFEFYSTEDRSRCFDLLSSKLPTSSSESPNLTYENPSKEYLSLNNNASFSENLISNPIKIDSSLFKSLPKVESHVKSGFSEEELNSLPVTLGMNEIHLKSPGSMHITCLTIGTRGDVQPYIALCRGLMKEGHRCRIATHLEYKPWIEGHGIEFKQVKGDPTVLMQLCVQNGMFTYSFFKEAMLTLRGWIDELLDSAWESTRDTDVLIESPTSMAGLHIAEKLGIPYFAAFPMPWSRTRVYPHPFMVSDTYLGGGFNYMTHVITEYAFWIGISGQVNKWRKNALQLPPIQLTNVGEHKMPYLYSFSAALVPPPIDWPDWIHTCGYWFLDNPDLNWSPPESLTSFLKNGRKPVYIGFGSIVVADPDQLIQTVLKAVQKAGIRVILSKGWSARSKKSDDDVNTEDLLKSMENIYVIDQVPHDWLFPQIAGVVHHGGAGTTAAGLRAGVPTIIKPFFGDQFFWAERVQDLGVGCSVRKLSVERLASALVQITTDEKIQERARLLGERIRSENGVQTAIKYIYRDLEYSRAQVEKLGLKTGSRTSSTTNVPTSSAPLSTTSTSSLLPSSLFSRKKTTHLPLQPPLQSLILEIAPSS